MMVDHRIRVVILMPTLAVRVGLRALLESDESIDVIADAVSVDALPDIFQDVDVVVAAPGAATTLHWDEPLAEGESRFSLLLIADDPQDASIPRELPLFSWGILSPEASQEELIAAVRCLNLGLNVAPPEFLEPLLASRFARQDDDQIDPLTPRETEVLQLLAQGLANKQMALELGISEHTVKFHISSIYSKMGATNRTEAIRLGLISGLVIL
jgi:DNA-binding NarL/FixJ family response regulator